MVRVSNIIYRGWCRVYLVAGLCVLLCVCAECNGQETRDGRPGMGVEMQLLGGRVFKHEAKFTLPIPALTTGVDVNLIWHTYGRKEWEQRRHYPRIGIAITGLHYGNDAVYGNLIGIYPNLTLPLITNNNTEWTLRIGNGVGYVNREYSRTAPVNTVNVAIGSKINDLIVVSSSIGYRVNDHWTLKAGGFVTHISNGSVRKPNLGVNVAGLSVGAAYYPVTSRPVKIVRELPKLPARYLIQLRYGMSLVSSNTAGGPLYPVYIGTGYVSRRWRSHNKVFAGVDYSYHTNINAHLRNNNLAVGREAKESYKSAVVVGNEYLMGRVGIMLQAGVYLKHSYMRKEDVYQKVTGTYYCIKREHGTLKELFVYTSLKAHLNVAEMGEMGIGVGL